MKHTQVQLRPPTRADELPFIDVRYCKSLNSSIASRTSRRPKCKTKRKRWTNPIIVHVQWFYCHQIYDLLRVGLCTCTEPVFWRPSWIPYQTVDFVPSGKLKPVLKWANVCSPNILGTVWRTVIRFLIERLVRWTWFGQSKFYFVLNWLVMRCKLRRELAADALQTAWSKM